MDDTLKPQRQSTSRQSNFELLRIISMILIVMHHFAVHGEYVGVTLHNAAIIAVFQAGGKIGVNVFVLISGYFLIDSKFRFKKIFKLIAEVLFYSIFIYLILLTCGKITFSVYDFFRAVFPVSSSTYWFATNYVILYCISPFLNIIVKNCNKSYFIFLILLLIFLQCAIPYIFGNEVIYNVGWFISLYFFAANLRIYSSKFFNSNKIMLPFAIFTYVIIAVVNIFTAVNLWEKTNIVCLICSVSIFCSFKNMKMKTSKATNLIAKTTFGIYLIHDNPYLRHILWVELLNCPFHANTDLFIIFALLSVIIVFFACMLIDFFRELIFCLFSKLFNKSLHKNV